MLFRPRWHTKSWEFKKICGDSYNPHISTLPNYRLFMTFYFGKYKKRVIKAVMSMPESQKYFPVMVRWVGFESSEITVDNGSLSSFTGSGTTYTFDVTPSAEGLVTVDIAAGVCTDIAGNSNAAAGQFSIHYLSTIVETWAKSIGGCNNESVYEMAVDNSGNIYITGTFNGTVDFDPGTGTTNITSSTGGYVAKYNTSGELEWATASQCCTEFEGIAVNSGGEAHITGGGNFEKCPELTVK